MAYSTIKRKTCKCGCGKPTSLGYKGFRFSCAPAEIKERVGTKKDVAKRNKNARNKVSNLLHKDSEADKTKLLAMADKLFGDYIKERDSDANGNIICPCCKLSYNVKEKASDGTYIVQPLHFVSRSVYSLRFDERQVYAGCCYCNFKMFANTEGEAVKNYQDMLVEKLGIVEVMRMVAQKRIINKLSVQDLKEVIERYKPK